MFGVSGFGAISIRASSILIIVITHVIGVIVS